MKICGNWNFVLRYYGIKYEYLGEAVCNEEERKLVQLAYFPPLNYTCYPAVSKQYIVPRDNPWIPSDGAFSLMKEMAEQVGDRKLKMDTFL